MSVPDINFKGAIEDLRKSANIAINENVTDPEVRKALISLSDAASSSAVASMNMLGQSAMGPIKKLLQKLTDTCAGRGILILIPPQLASLGLIQTQLTGNILGAGEKKRAKKHTKKTAKKPAKKVTKKPAKKVTKKPAKKPSKK